MRIKFTIRGLLWLIVVAALVVGWWTDHRKLGAVIDDYRHMPFAIGRGKAATSERLSTLDISAAIEQSRR